MGVFEEDVRSAESRPTHSPSDGGWRFKGGEAANSAHLWEELLEPLPEGRRSLENHSPFRRTCGAKCHQGALSCGCQGDR